MAPFDTGNDVQAISPADLTMLQQTLQVWCNQHDIPRSEAIPQARILMDSYQKGRRTQIELIDALVASKQ